MNHFTTLIYQYGVFAMFIIILIEYACFPISSEILLPFTGALASLQHTSYFLILSISVIAGLLGTSICYFLGRLGGIPFLERIIKKFPKSQKPIDISRAAFQKYGIFAVCIGRLIPICRTYIAFIAGASKQKYTTYLFSSFIGITLWNAILLGLGYYFREKWGMVKIYYEKYKQGLIPIIVLCLLLYLFFYSHKRKKH